MTSLLMLSLPWLALVVTVAAVVALIAKLALTRRWPRVRIAASAILLLCVPLAVVDFGGAALLQNNNLNAYEFYHYYLGAKYARELGYTKLYAATVVAQQELGHRPLPPRARDLASGETVQRARILEDGAAARERFSAARWNEFKADVDYFWRQFKNKNTWHRMLLDKGYNPSPFYTAVAGPFTSFAPTSDPARLNLLLLLDVLWTIAAIAAVWWAYGHRPALLLFLFLATHYLASHNTLRGAFLRLDWLMALIIAMCLLSRERGALAGVLVAYAALERVFPVLFAAGALGLVLWRLLLALRRRGTPPAAGTRTALRFLAGFGGAGAVFLVWSIIYAGGISSWIEFAQKISAHNTDIAPWRMGFRYFAMWGFDGTPISLEPWMTPYRLAQGALLLLWFLPLRGLRDDELFASSFMPVYILTSSTFYYWVMLALPFLFFARRLDSPLRTFTVAGMFLMSLAGHWLYRHFDRGYTTFFYLSGMTLAICLLMVLVATIGSIVRHEGIGARRPGHEEVA